MSENREVFKEFLDDFGKAVESYGPEAEYIFESFSAEDQKKIIWETDRDKFFEKFEVISYYISNRRIMERGETEIEKSADAAREIYNKFPLTVIMDFLPSLIIALPIEELLEIFETHKENLSHNKFMYFLTGKFGRTVADYSLGLLDLDVIFRDEDLTCAEKEDLIVRRVEDPSFELFHFSYQWIDFTLENGYSKMDRFLAGILDHLRNLKPEILSVRITSVLVPIVRLQYLPEYFFNWMINAMALTGAGDPALIRLRDEIGDTYKEYIEQFYSDEGKITADRLFDLRL